MTFPSLKRGMRTVKHLVLSAPTHPNDLCSLSIIAIGKLSPEVTIQCAKGDNVILLKYNMQPSALAIVIGALLVGCRAEAPQPDGNRSVPANPAPNNQCDDDVQTVTGKPMDETNIAKIKVFADGTILLNDKQVTIDELKTALTKIKDMNGVVWYYRENATGEPPPQATSVIEAIIDLKLPVKLSNEPDFSVFVRPGGR